MKNWQAAIASSKGTTTWAALEAYVKERIDMHTSMCISTGSSIEQVRSSQSAIVELRRLIELPERLGSIKL